MIISLAKTHESVILFDEAPPVVWADTHKYVSKGITYFNLLWYATSPCEALKQFQENQIRISDPEPGEIEQVYNRCELIFRDQIVDKISRMVNPVPKPKLPPKNIPMQPPLPMPAPHYPPSSNPGNVRMPPRPNPGRIPRESSVDSEKSFNETRNPSEIAELVRSKRGLTDFVTGAFISNIVNTVLDRLWPNPAQELMDRQRVIDEELKSLNRNLNISRMISDSFRQAVEIQAELLQSNIDRITDIVGNHPEMMLVSANFVAKMHITGNYIDRLRTSFKTNRPDLVTLALLLDTEILQDIDADSIEHKSISISPINNAMAGVKFSFAARQRDTDYSVIRVDPFEIWANLTTKVLCVNPQLVCEERSCTIYDRTCWYETSYMYK